MNNNKIILEFNLLMSQSNTIDNNLYDRQIRTYGEEAVKKMTSSSVLIMGLDKGLATEVGKNLALGGIRNIYLYDTENVSQSDLETGFYYSVDSINQPRSQVLANKLQEFKDGWVLSEIPGKVCVWAQSRIACYQRRLHAPASY